MAARQRRGWYGRPERTDSGCGRCLGLTAAVMGLLAWSAGATPLVLVADQATAYCIHHAPDSPAPVTRAAQELQRVIAVATGVTLPLMTEPAERMVSVGDSPAARAAGIDGGKLVDNAFIVRTIGERLFIVGHDLAPGAERWNFQMSNGTYLGVCRFLEEAVGVRWLLPGDDGEDIPGLRRLEIPATDRHEQPRFAAVCQKDLHDRDPSVLDWKARYGIVDRLPLGWAHSFDDHPDVAVLKAHPEYMAQTADGSRLPVPGGKPYSRLPTWKYCLTNPGLVDAFVDSINQAFDRDPKRLGDAMSPSDGPYWCQCAACQTLTMPADTTKWPGANPKVRYLTPLVLQFYNQVASRVATKHPDRIVGALAYQHYLYPPAGVVRLAPNIILGLATSNGYGFKFYKPERAQEIQGLFADWSRFSDRLGYSDYSTWMRNWFGCPVPSGRPLLKTVFPALGRSTVQYVIWNGTHAWGYGALNNYLTARLLWNPQADVEALAQDFLQRAYGPAAPAMDRLDRLIEDGLREYILAQPNPDHELDYAMIKAVWAPRWPEIERLFGEAETAAQTEPQRRRLALYADNLVIAHHNLRQAGLVPNPESSRFHRTDAALAAFLSERKDSLAINDFAAMCQKYRYAERPVLKPGWRPH